MKKAVRITVISVVVLFIVAISAMFIKGISPISLGLHESVYQTDGVGLNGYDVTSYFDGEPQIGSEDHMVEYGGLEWRFTSEEHKNAFLDNPTQFLPQFGGYCAKAVSTGFTGPSDPQIYEIYQDKLYIFSGENAKKEFLENPEEMINGCTANWK